MAYKFGKKSLENSVGVDYRLIEISNRALEISVIDFGIPEYGGLRTADEQLQLFLRSASKADGTRFLSKHQSGLALDFYAFVNGKASWHPGHLAMVAAAHLQAAREFGYKLTWGGLWKPWKITDGIPHGWDSGHVQLED